MLSQQPLQFAGPHVVGIASHFLLVLQNCCEVHWTQVWPLAPHALWPVPGWQAPPASQQPFGQLVALHCTLTQAWFWHCWPVWHCWHCPPFFPQRPALLPGMHCPL